MLQINVNANRALRRICATLAIGASMLAIRAGSGVDLYAARAVNHW